MIISSEDMKPDEILPLYYTRQQIEQVFDISKNYAEILPLRVHSEETFRGVKVKEFFPVKTSYRSSAAICSFRL